MLQVALPSTTLARKPNTWVPMTYHPMHAALWRTQAQFVNVVAGRQSGKTEIAIRKLIASLGIKKPWANPMYVYCMPTFQQARRAVWYRAISMIPKEWLHKESINKSEACITTNFGSTLYIMGMDKPYRLEGLTLDGIVIDESSDQRPDMFQKTVVPMLAVRKGWCWRIGVPKKSGVGRVEFREFFNRGLTGEDPDIQSFTWPSSEVWTPDRVAMAKLTMDYEAYQEQCNAEWLDAGGGIYHCFDYSRNVRQVKYDPTQPIVVGCDFNVSPMCWTLSHFTECDGQKIMWVFDEIFLDNDANTRKTLDFLYSKYGQHKSGWRFIGDASSRNRHTSSTRSDYLTIKNDIRFLNKTVVFPTKNPHLRDRWATVNTALYNANAEVHLFVDTSCRKLINDFEVMCYKEGTSELEDYAGTKIGHMSDAVGYVVCMCMPMRVQSTAVPEVITRN